MPKILFPSLDQDSLSVLGIRAMSLVLLIGFVNGVGDRSFTCHAATLTLQQQSDVWREAFPLGNVGMAPSTFPAAKTVPKAGLRERSHRPHPAVARIVVPEDGATSYGSGTLIDVRENFGMVITNWHVVRDATGTIEVIFPDGFKSKARAVKVDSDWDLAALVIWRPTVEPVSIAAAAPRPGDELTICGYGQGMYRALTGRCTQYYAPRLDFPRHMVELDVEARQGDSGGPIFNTQGELAGVLFGAGEGTTLGSFGGRVEEFLASLAPNIGQATAALAVESTREKNDVWNTRPAATDPFATKPTATIAATTTAAESHGGGWPVESADIATTVAVEANFLPTDFVPITPTSVAQQQTPEEIADWQSDSGRKNPFEQMKTILAAIGLLAIVVQMLRIAR